eukprot:882523-Pleurochrysis_carterae.AAC.1
MSFSSATSHSRHLISSRVEHLSRQETRTKKAESQQARVDLQRRRQHSDVARTEVVPCVLTKNTSSDQTHACTQ